MYLFLRLSCILLPRIPPPSRLPCSNPMFQILRFFFIPLLRFSSTLFSSTSPLYVPFFLNLFYLLLSFSFTFFLTFTFFIAFHSSFLISFPLFQTTSTRTSRTRAWCRRRRPNTTWGTWSVERSAPGSSLTATAGTAACRVLTSLGSTRETSPATTPSDSRSVILRTSVVLETLHLGR